MVPASPAEEERPEEAADEAADESEADRKLGEPAGPVLTDLTRGVGAFILVDDLDLD
jgi:hypothetical protein